jgi:Flp pilus assembly pilin Flp
MTKIQKMAGTWFARVLGEPVATTRVREDGQTLAEYALILAFIAVAVVLAVTFLGGQIDSLFSTIGSDI